MNKHKDNELLRQFGVMRKLKNELCPDFEFEPGQHNRIIIYNHYVEKWESMGLLLHSPGLVYFNCVSAEKAVNMLNSGEVKI